MGLQMSITADQTDVGVDAPEAYARIAAIAQDFDRGTVQVVVNTYFNQAAATAGKVPLSSRSIDGGPDLFVALAGSSTDDTAVPPGGGTINTGHQIGGGVAPPPARVQCYDFLKTLPDFAAAVDV